MASYTLALTGNIGCGKSAAAACFARHGAVAVDADRLGHRCFDPAHPAYSLLSGRFPDAVLDDGSFDRKRLAAAVFADAESKRALEAIVWPFVFDEVRLRADACRGVFVWEAAQIVEAMRQGYPVRRFYDALAVVTAPPPTQRTRLRGRGLSDAEIDLRIAAQLPQEEKTKYAQYVLLNAGTPQCLDAAVAAVLSDIGAVRQPF